MGTAVVRTDFRAGSLVGLGLWGGLWCLLAMATPAAAQEPADTRATVVSLASPQTPPEGETFITIMLANAPDQQVRVLKTQIEFHDRELIYIAARTSFAADVVGARLDLVVQDAKQALATPVEGLMTTPLREGKSRVLLTLTARRPLPNGPLAELRFRVAPEFDEGPARTAAGAAAATTPASPSPTTSTPPEAAVPADAPQVVLIKVDHQSAGWTGDGTRLERLVSEPGEIRVTTAKKDRVPIVFGCFFYMH